MISYMRKEKEELTTEVKRYWAKLDASILEKDETKAIVRRNDEKKTGENDHPNMK